MFSSGFNHPTHSSLWKIFWFVWSLGVELVSRVCTRLLIIVDVHSLARPSSYLGCCRHTDRGMFSRINMTGVVGIPIFNGKQTNCYPEPDLLDGDILEVGTIRCVPDLLCDLVDNVSLGRVFDTL